MTKAEILAIVQDRTGRGSDITSIDDELRAILLEELSTEFPFLRTSETIAISAGVASYSIVNVNFRSIETVKIDDGEPLEKINAWEDYHELIAEETSADRDEPDRYIIRKVIDSTKIYFYPTPDTTYTATLYFSIYHPESLATIYFGEEFREAIIQGVCFKIYEGIGMGDTPEAQVHATIYQREKAKLLLRYKAEEPTRKVEYRDV